MSVKTENKEVTKVTKKKVVKEDKKVITKKIFCHATSQKDTELDYHLCKHKDNHEGEHRCCACPTTW